MADVGIDLPNNILVHLILFKFPPTLESLRQQIMQGKKLITVEVVFNHLTQYNNKRKAQLKTGKSATDVSLVNFKSRPNKDNRNPRDRKSVV